MGIDAQINGVRTQLASAQPLEVALRGTLGPVAQARAALQRAEAKASKLEAHVVTAAAAHEGAMADVQSCQKQLAEAEATIAISAGGRFDPRLLIGAHPGAALTILSEAAAARCVVGSPGVDSALVARVQAAFSEVQAACRLLPADVPTPTPPQPASQPGSDGSPQQQTNGHPMPPEMPSGEAASGGIAGAFPGSASNGTTGANGSSPKLLTAPLATQQLLLQQHLQQQEMVQQQALQQQAAAAQALQAASSGAHPAQAETPHPPLDQQGSTPAGDPTQLAAQQQAQQAAAQLAIQHAQAAPAQASQLTSANPAVAAGTGPASAAAAAGQQLQQGVNQGQTGQAQAPGGVAEAAGAAAQGGPHEGGAVGDDTGNTDAGEGINAGPLQPLNDSMGGGAADTIVNKRPAAAMEAARAIAAKAKARAN